MRFNIKFIIGLKNSILILTIRNLSHYYSIGFLLILSLNLKSQNSISHGLIISETDFNNSLNYLSTRFAKKYDSLNFSNSKILYLNTAQWILKNEIANRSEKLIALIDIGDVQDEKQMGILLRESFLKIPNNDNKEQIARYYFEIGSWSNLQENYPKALIYLNKFLTFENVSFSSSFVDKYWTTYKELGYLNYKLGNYQEALRCYQQFYLRVKDKSYYFEPSALNDIGLCYKLLNKKDSAIVYFNKSIERIEYYHNLPIKDRKYKHYFKPIVEASMFDYYIEDKEYRKAVLLGMGELNGGMIYEVNDLGAISRGYYKILTGYYYLNDYQNFNKNFNAFENSIKEMPQTNLYQKAIRLSIKFNTMRKDFEAVSQDIVKLERIDSILNSQTKIEKLDLINQTNLSLKDQEIDYFGERIKLIEGHNKIKNIAIVIFCCLVCVILFFFYRLRKAKQILEEQNEKQKILIREIHHRVKNNLQLISSYIQLQVNKSTNPDVQNFLGNTIKNIESIALVHQNLYKNEDFYMVGLKGFLDGICQNVQAFTNEKNIAFFLDVEDNEVPIDTAINIGLIINELITNSIKYAFLNEGKIKIKIVRLDSPFLEIQYFDNGQGTDIETIKKKKSIGMTMIEEIVCRELRGSFSYQLDNGFGIIIKIKI